MITCFLKYIIDPDKTQAFEHYGKLWIGLVNHMGGVHHGYLLPHEGASNIALASFSFPSLSDYEIYRKEILSNENCQNALDYARKSGCIISYERSFMKPIFQGYGN